MKNIEYKNLLKKMGWVFFSEEYPSDYGEYTTVIVTSNDGYEGLWRWDDMSKQKILDNINSGAESIPVMWRYKKEF